MARKISRGRPAPTGRGRDDRPSSLRPPARGNWFRSRRIARNNAAGFVFISPFLLLFGAFSIWPDIDSLFLSFEQYAGFGPKRPVGFGNYRALLQYSAFWTEVGNTLFYWVAHAVIVIPLAFIVALLLRSKLIKGAKFWKPLIFLPQVMNVVAVSLVWQTLFSTRYGVINSVFGIHVAWLTDYSLARWIVVLLLVWQGLGFWFVVFLAGLTAVDPAILEAAIIDGAGAFRRTISVVVPLMRRVILFAVIIDAIGSMSLYTQPNVLLAGSGMANPSVSTLSNLEVGNLQSGVFGQSAAAGWLLFVLTLVVTAVVFGGNWLLGGRSSKRGRVARWKNRKRPVGAVSAVGAGL